MLPRVMSQKRKEGEEERGEREGVKKVCISRSKDARVKCASLSIMSKEANNCHSLN